MRRTALVVTVPEAHPVVDDLRRQHDPMTVLGVLAHVTVLHPFRPEIDDTTAEQVADVARAIEPFDVRFARTGSFPGVVYLAPEPADPFADLTQRCIEVFPDCPPYEGRFPDTVPHLTIGVGLDGDAHRQLSEDVSSRLPIEARVTELTLLVENDEGGWSVGRSWPLGTSG